MEHYQIKFSIGTVSKELDLSHDITLLKAALLYADEIEIIGMMEYALGILIPQIINSPKGGFDCIEKLLPLFESLGSQEVQNVVMQTRAILEQMQPFLHFKNKKMRNKQEMQVAINIGRMENVIISELKKVIDNLSESSHLNELQELINTKIVSISNYSLQVFDVDRMSEKYLEKICQIATSKNAFPVFDSITTDLINSIINLGIINTGNMNKEVANHAGIANGILSTLPSLAEAEFNELVEIKKELFNPLQNFRKSIFDFSKEIESAPWDNDFQYDCLKLYHTKVVPQINEINALIRDNGIIKNIARNALKDSSIRASASVVAGGLSTVITASQNIVDVSAIITGIIKSGATIGTTAAVVTGLLKSGDIALTAYNDYKSIKQKIEGNSMYFYYKASEALNR